MSKKDAADVIYLNGKVYTVNKSQEWAQAFALKDGRFLQVGTNEEIQTLRGEKTEVVDLKEEFVMPGFIDSHIHPLRSQLMEDFDISISAAVPIKPEEFAAKVKKYADNHPDKEWLVGAAFSWGTFENTKLNSAFIDAIVKDRPVVIEDETGHIAIANSKALGLAGVTESIEDPEGGYYGRNEDGTLNGLLYETAMQEVFKHSPNYTVDQITSSGRKIFRRLNSMGFTGVKIAQGDENWMKGVQQLDNAGDLKMQISMAPYEIDFYRLYSNMDVLKNRAQYETDHFEVKSIKLLADGVPFGKTMYIKETYPDTDNHGVPFIKPEDMINKIVEFNAMGLSVMVHCTGDAAADLVLQGTEKSMKANGAEKVRKLRNHICHNVIVDSNDYERMKNTNVIMEFSPSFWFPRPIIDQAEADLGPVMLQKVWPFGPTARSGANVAIGSDWNQTQADPFINTETLVTRRAPGATEEDPILGVESAASLERVIKAYTLGGAYAMFKENEFGSIENGKNANFIVLDQNLFEIPENTIHKTMVKQTYFEGELVYEGAEKVSF